MNDTAHPLILSDELLIGSGTERDCYQHPEDPNLCIKVNNGKVFPSKKAAAKQNQIEYRFYKRLNKSQQRTSIIPACYGWVETNKGRGLVFDLIRNADQSIASRLVSALDAGEIQTDQAVELLAELKQHMLNRVIIPSDLHPDNILVQKTSRQSRLVLVDGIGNRNLIKFAETFSWIGRLKIERHWLRLQERLQRTAPHFFSELTGL